MTTLRKQVSDALAQLGYRRRGRAHLRRIDDDFSFCVDTGPIGPKTDIAPYVGFRSDVVETTTAELMSLPADEWTAAAGANVGYVRGRDYAWWNNDAPAQPIVEDILAALESMRPFMTLRTMADVFSRDWAARNPGTPYSLVVIALLNGDHALVTRRLSDAERILCYRPDEVCEQYRAFEARVRARLASTR